MHAVIMRCWSSDPERMKQGKKQDLRAKTKITVLDFRRADFGLQRVEAGTGNLGGIQRLFLNMQRCS